MREKINFPMAGPEKSKGVKKIKVAPQRG